MQYNSAPTPDVDKSAPKPYSPLRRVGIFSLMLMAIGVGIFAFSVLLRSDFSSQTARIAELAEAPDSTSAPTPPAPTPPAPSPVVETCISNVANFSVTEPCATRGFKTVSYQCNGWEETAYLASSPTNCYDLSTVYQQVLETCGQSCTKPSPSPTPTPPPTADPTAIPTACSTKTYKLPPEAIRTPLEEALQSRYLVNPNTTTAKPGDYFGFNIEISNLNTYSIAGGLRATTTNLNGAQEPWSIVSVGSDCDLDINSKTLACSDPDFLLEASSSALANMHMIFKVGEPSALYTTTGVTYNATNGALDLDCGSVKIPYSAPPSTPTPTPTPTPKPTLTPTPTPTPRASGLSDLPVGCYYKQVQCIQAPCDPIMVCPTPTPTASVSTVEDQPTQGFFTPITRGFQSFFCSLRCVGSNGFGSWNSCQLDCKY